LAELHQRSYPEAKLSHLGTGPLQNRTVHRSGWETDYAEISPRPLPVEPLDHFCRNGQWTTSGRTNHYRKEQRIDDEPEGGGKRDDRNCGGVSSSAGSGSDCFTYCWSRDGSFSSATRTNFGQDEHHHLCERTSPL